MDDKQVISDYMRSLAMKSREAVAKKYGVEGGKNTLYSEMGKRRWVNHKKKKREEAIKTLEKMIEEADGETDIVLK